jgi:hypothetical protein
LIKRAGLILGGKSTNLPIIFSWRSNLSVCRNLILFFFPFFLLRGGIFNSHFRLSHRAGINRADLSPPAIHDEHSRAHPVVWRDVTNSNTHMKLPCLYSYVHGTTSAARTDGIDDRFSSPTTTHTHTSRILWYTHKEYYGEQQSSQQQHAQRILALFFFGHNIHQRSFRWTSMEGNEVRYQIHLTICSQRLCICRAPKKTPAQPQQPESGRRKKKSWANRLDFLVVYT